MEQVNTRVNSFKDELEGDFKGFKLQFSERIESLIASLQSRESEVLNDSNEFKSRVEGDLQEVKDQLNLIVSEVNSKTNQLKDTLSSISEEQDKYISETEIFSRTDKLKSDLERSIDILSQKLKETDEKSDFVDLTNDKLEVLRPLLDQINGDIDNIENKRAKIDSLENRVNKVLDLSNSVDDKLKRIKESEGYIGEIQLKLRELKELEDSVSLEFNRLENKEAILEETNKAIDSGFSHVQIIENKLELLRDNITPFNNQIDNFKEKLIKVEEREKSINKAIDTLTILDSAIVDMDNKIEKMDKAREWIAGVETRLNESVRVADEQVKLMGALAQNKNDSSSKKSDTSAPNMNMRDMVIKLAHNGWKPEDIARTTKLSRGEVELILELSPRK